MAQPGRGLALFVAAGGLVAGGLLFLHYDRMLEEPRAQAEQIAEISPMVQQTLGVPLRFGRFPQAKLHGGNGEGNVDMRISVSGPAGSGTLIEWAQQSAGQWRICSLVFRPDSGARTIGLVDRDSSHCEAE